MIVSYETLRTLSEYLANCSIGLLLCDEGHRLKNSGTRFLDSQFHNLIFRDRLFDVPVFERTERQAARYSFRNTDPGKFGYLLRVHER